MSPATPPPVHLYQLAYSPETLASIEPGYKVLDNLENSRPDWYEYWAIRRFLLSETLDDNAYYGFFSPKFGTKTGLTHAQVTQFVQAHAASTDVFLFSPQPDMGAFFLNVFEQGEAFDPGLIDSFSSLLESIGRTGALRQMVMDSRQVVFSNYFIARPAFWREWLSVNEALFAVCEGPESPLQLALTQQTTYPGAAQRKVFLMERVASYLLTTQPRWRTKAANTFEFGWSVSRFRDHPSEAFISDALKIAYRDQGFPQYLSEFIRVRERFRSGAAASNAA
jgi:hypothetical protein